MNKIAVLCGTAWPKHYGLHNKIGSCSDPWEPIKTEADSALIRATTEAIRLLQRIMVATSDETVGNERLILGEIARIAAEGIVDINIARNDFVRRT